MVQEEIPVLIVGAGPIGLAASILLDQQGVSSIVVDRKSDFDDHPRARFMDSCTLELFRQLGVADAVEETGIGPDWTEVMTIAETIAVPQKLFPDLADIREVPNTLYDLYESRYGITIARAVERLAAVAADARDAKLLDVATGTPLLEIDRAALALDGTPVEWRVSRCLTATHHYQVELS